MTTTIQIQDETWQMLNARKSRGETFDSVIRKALIKLNEVKHENNNESN